MRRYWIPKQALSGDRVGDQVVLTGNVLHHIRDVCRQTQGSKFEVIVEGGSAYFVEITSESKHQSIARVLEIRSIEPLPLPHIHLAMSIPRFPVFEAVVEKAVELGVSRIQPFFSEFSFIKKQEDVFAKKRPRFEKIIVSATQQCGRGELMTISEPVGLEKLIQTFNLDKASAGLFAYEGQSVLSAREALVALERFEVGCENGSVDGFGAGVSQRRPNDIWAFVGAEGGFSEREVQLFQSVGLKPVTLGRQVLRVETACVALISIIKYGFDLMR